MNDIFVKKFRASRIALGKTIEEMAQCLGVDSETILKYEEGVIAPSLKFIEKAEEFFNISANEEGFQNIFTQGYFGTKVPLLSDEDLINDCANHVIYYFELPHLSKYGENNLFALRYKGNDILDKGILHDSILVFYRCDKIDRDGIYAVIKRKSLSIKEATLTDDYIRIVPLDSKRRFPSKQKSSVASGRLVCCINNF